MTLRNLGCRLVGLMWLALDAGAQSLSDELVSLLNETPQVRSVETVAVWGPDCKKPLGSLPVMRLKEAERTWHCLFDDEGYRCRVGHQEEGHTCKDWSESALGTAPPYGPGWEHFLERLSKPRAFLSVSDVATKTRLRALELGDSSFPNGSWQIAIHDGSVWRVSRRLEPVLELEVDDAPSLNGTALFGAPAWGLVLSQGTAGQGNNGSGSFAYLVAFFVARGDRLELEASAPLGYTAFSRGFTGEGFSMHSTHTLLCPSIVGTQLQLAPACRGSGDPRSFGQPLRELCARARTNTCQPGGDKPDPLVRRSAGSYVLREKAFVPAAAAGRIKALSTVQLPSRDDEPRARRTTDLFVSERAWEIADKQPVEWLELQNTTKQWLDLRGLELEDENHLTGKLTESCIISPGGVVVLTKGHGPSWVAGRTECFYGDSALVGHITLTSPAGVVDQTWSTYGVGSGYSFQLNATGGYELAKQSPGVPNTVPAAK